MNIDQLELLTEVELNKVVGRQFGLDLSGITDDNVGMYSGFPFYTTSPELYMKIAIENCIDINFKYESDVVAQGAYESGYYPRSQTGRAVCIAFLLMNGESND